MTRALPHRWGTEGIDGVASVRNTDGMPRLLVVHYDPRQSARPRSRGTAPLTLERRGVRSHAGETGKNPP